MIKILLKYLLVFVFLTFTLNFIIYLIDPYFHFDSKIAKILYEKFDGIEKQNYIKFNTNVNKVYFIDKKKHIQFDGNVFFKEDTLKIEGIGLEKLFGWEVEELYYFDKSGFYSTTVVQHFVKIR